MSLNSGDIVGDYRVLELIGTGGMGAVYKTEHLISKRIEAMKLLLISLGSGPDEERRFEREIRVQARLQHPHIAALYNAVRLTNSIALVMEFVEGEALSRILERGRLPVVTAVDLACQVLDALSHAHDHGVIHRDVAPGNILITRDGTAKLTDFGLARAVNDLQRSSTGVAAGSLWYMSPEQVAGAETVDFRTDIYATGAVLHEMLTGRKLFDVDGAFAIMSAQMGSVPPAPSEFNGEVPKALDAIVARALAKDPAERFRSAGEFRGALQAAVSGSPPSAGVMARGRGLVRAAKPVAVAVVLLLTAGSVWLWSSRRVVARKPVRAQQVRVAMPPVTAPATVPEPIATEAEIAPEESPRPAARTRAARKITKHDPTFGIVISGGERPQTAVPPRIPRPLNPPVPATAPAVHPNSDALASVPAPVTVEPAATPEPLMVVQERPGAPPAEASPSKTGNRFVRALGKINPFAWGAKKKGDEAGKQAPAAQGSDRN